MPEPGLHERMPASASLEQVRHLVASDPETALQRLVEVASRLDLRPADAGAVSKLGIRFQRGLLPGEQLPAAVTDLVDRLSSWILSPEGQQASVRAQESKRRVTERSLEESPRQSIAFRCQGLGKTYGQGAFSLGTLDLCLRTGEITGVVGQNAHGKTTLLRTVAGELAPTAGSVEYPLLAEPTDPPDWQRIRAGIAFVPQELPAWRGRLRETLLFEAAVHGVAPADNEREVEFMVARLGLAEHIEKSWGQLSGGFRLRFALARALVWKPRLLVLDEPLANLDVLAKSRLLEDIRDLAQSVRNPIAILMSSHDLFDLEEVCQQMVFLRNGKVLYSGPAGGGPVTGQLFLLTTRAPKEQLLAVLREAGLPEVREEGLHYLLRAPVGMGPQEILRVLLDGGVVPGYFRDISRSVRRMFE